MRPLTRGVFQSYLTLIGISYTYLMGEVMYLSSFTDFTPRALMRKASVFVGVSAAAIWGDEYFIVRNHRTNGPALPPTETGNWSITRNYRLKAMLSLAAAAFLVGLTRLTPIDNTLQRLVLSRAENPIQA